MDDRYEVRNKLEAYLNMDEINKPTPKRGGAKMKGGEEE